VLEHALETPPPREGTQDRVGTLPGVRIILDETVRYGARGTAQPSGIGITRTA